MLSKGELRKIYTMIETHPQGGTDLADRVEAQVNNDLAAEVRAWRWQSVGLMALTMVINAGMVGLGLSLGMGQWAVNVNPGQNGQGPTISAPVALPMVEPPAVTSGGDVPSVFMVIGGDEEDSRPMSILLSEAYFDPDDVLDALEPVEFDPDSGE